MTTLKRTVVAGWFGAGNFGDELLLHSTLVLLEELGISRQQIDVMCGNPSLASQQHSVDAGRLPVIRRRHQIGGTPASTLLSEAGTLILGPGTIFQERSPSLPWPGTLPMLLRLVAMAKSRGIRIVLFGVGVREDLTSLGRAALRAIGTTATSLGARDGISASRFGPAAAVIGDVAWTTTFPNRPAIQGPHLNRAFAVSLRPIPGAPGVSMKSEVLDAAISLVERGWSGTYLPMSRGVNATGEDDLSVTDPRIGGALPVYDAHLGPDVFNQSLDAYTSLLTKLDLMIATRLHAAVTAVMAGVPTVAIAYEQKVLRMMESVGLERHVLHPADLSAVDILRLVDRLGSGAMEQATANAQERALKWGDQARSFLGEALT